MKLTKETIADIKNEVNIVDIIGEVVALTKSGRQYLGLCPFHKEKTPSFNVLEDRQFFHCFGCGKSGDVFKFLEEYRQITFIDAVKILAERLNLPLELSFEGKAQRQHIHQELFDINQAALNFFHALLMTTTAGESAKQYLYSRGLTDEHLAYFKIGLSPAAPDYLYHALSKKWSEEHLLNSGLFLSTEHNRIFDSFQNRIMFPLLDEEGRCVGFSGRIWQEGQEQEAKYKNTRSTPIFNKSYELYHLDKAKPFIKKQGVVYLTEGFMDVIASYRAGVPNTVATMGTALTLEHVSRLKKLTNKVVLAYDGDGAGQEAIAKSLELLQDFSVDIVRFPEKMDPDEFLQKNSELILRELLTQSRMSQVEFWMQYLLPAHFSNLQVEIAYVEQMAKIIAKEPSLTAQATYIGLLADLVPDFDYYQIEQSVNNERLQGQPSVARQEILKPARLELSATKQLSALERAEYHLFHRLLHHPNLLNDFRLKEDFTFYSPHLAQLYQILKREGEVTAMDLSNLPDEVTSVYYGVLNENLPDEVTSEEIEDILQQRKRFLLVQDMSKQSKLIRESSQQRDADLEILALEQFIAQKRRME